MPSDQTIQQAADTALRLRQRYGYATLQAIRQAADYHRVAASDIGRELARRRRISTCAQVRPAQPTEIGWRGSPQ